MEKVLMADLKYCYSVPCAWQDPKVELVKHNNYYRCPMCDQMYGDEVSEVKKDPVIARIDAMIASHNKVDVLNGGFVRLVDWMGDDLSIVRSARVSYDADWREEDEGKDAKLIKYLMKNKHTSPFEAVSFTFEVKAPIFVFRQWHRHRTWSYNEISARYTELDEGWYVPEVEQITTQSTSNKQMRTNEKNPEAYFIKGAIDGWCEEAFNLYKKLMELGCPRELARSVLPVAAYSRMFATVDLHNLMHFLRLRLHEHSQYEIRVYADAILKLIEPIVPVAIVAFKETL
jgi:thymidylate synthase (FAD)